MDWANHIEKGRFDKITKEQFDQWKDYDIYMCNVCTNFCAVSFDFLSKLKEAIPEFLPVYYEYLRMNEISKTITGKLEKLGGFFNADLTNLQNIERRKSIA